MQFCTSLFYHFSYPIRIEQHTVPLSSWIFFTNSFYWKFVLILQTVTRQTVKNLCYVTSLILSWIIPLFVMPRILDKKEKLLADRDTFHTSIGNLSLSEVYRERRKFPCYLRKICPLSHAAGTDFAIETKGNETRGISFRRHQRRESRLSAIKHALGGIFT